MGAGEVDTWWVGELIVAVIGCCVRWDGESEVKLPDGRVVTCRLLKSMP